MLQATRRGENPAAELDELRRIADMLPPGNSMRSAVEDLIASTTGLKGDAGSRISDEDLARMTALADGAEHPDLQAMAYAQAGMAALAQGQQTDLVRVDAGIARLRRAVELAGTSHPQHVFLMTGLALGLFRRSELTGARGSG